MGILILGGVPFLGLLVPQKTNANGRVLNGAPPSDAVLPWFPFKTTPKRVMLTLD